MVLSHCNYILVSPQTLEVSCISFKILPWCNFSLVKLKYFNSIALVLYVFDLQLKHIIHCELSDNITTAG